MSESMDKYYRDLIGSIAGAKIGGKLTGSLVGAAAGAKAGREALAKPTQKKAKGGVVRKMKKGGKVK
jgi:hypothetical protein|tara:strand:+ start:49 stop:249 length:201 start_codon:yes stop_codon:yes gene_type:complete